MNSIIKDNDNLNKQLNEMKKKLDQKDKQLSDNNLFKQKIEQLKKENNELFNQKNSKEK